MSIGFIPEINTRQKWKKKRNKTVFVLGENQIRKNYKSVIFKTLHLVLCTYPPPSSSDFTLSQTSEPHLTPYSPPLTFDDQLLLLIAPHPRQLTFYFVLPCLVYKKKTQCASITVFLVCISTHSLGHRYYILIFSRDSGSDTLIQGWNTYISSSFLTDNMHINK